MVNRITDIQSQGTLAYNTLREPISAASLYYAMYWLREVENEPAVGFDLDKLENDLWLAFQFYGIYSVARELGNAGKHFNAGGRPIEAYNDLPRGQPRLRDELEEQLGVDLEPPMGGTGRGSLDSLLLDSDRLLAQSSGAFADANEMVNMVEEAEEVAGAASDPDRFLDMAATIFDVGHGDEWGWRANYGGQAWAGICQHLRRADELTKTLWINQSWAVQHNNAVWLNKIFVSMGERETAGEVFQFLYPGTPLNPPIANAEVFTPVLNLLLEERQTGNMEPVFAFAREYDDKVGVNLRSLGRRHGVTTQAIRDWIEPDTLRLSDLQAVAVERALEKLSQILFKAPGDEYVEWVKEWDPDSSRDDRQKVAPRLGDELAVVINRKFDDPRPRGTGVAQSDVGTEGSVISWELSTDDARRLVFMLQDTIRLYEAQLAPARVVGDAVTISEMGQPEIDALRDLIPQIQDLA